jgi:ankyrin repeat protein
MLLIGNSSDVWKIALPWLLEENHVSTSEEVEQLKSHFRKHPRNAEVKLGRGHLPLHYVAKNQRGEHVIMIVKALLAANPQATREKTNDGWLPLHFAAQTQNGEHGLLVVEALLTTYVQGALQSTNKGSLPMHIAQAHNSSEIAILARLKQATSEAGIATLLKQVADGKFKFQSPTNGT